MRRRPPLEVTVSRQAYRYWFSPEVALGDIAETLHLSLYAAEGIHGRTRVRLEVGYEIDREARICTVNAATPVGETVVQIFTSYLAREFGEDSFSVQRTPIDEASERPPDVETVPR